MTNIQRANIVREIRAMNWELSKTTDQEIREQICRDIKALREELRAAEDSED